MSGGCDPCWPETGIIAKKTVANREIIFIEFIRNALLPTPPQLTSTERAPDPMGFHLGVDFQLASRVIWERHPAPSGGCGWLT